VEVERVYTVDALIEIPEGSRNKYEYDRKTGRIYFNRMLFSSIRYPTNYGLIPNTLALDGDELDILVVTSEPVFPGCYVVARPIGGLEMSDEKGKDEKILAVPVGEPRWQSITSRDQLPPHMLLEIEHFFLRYKELEHKFTRIDGWHDADWAIKIIKEAQERFRRQQAKEQGVTPVL
jgi:inorganic pyrophosphatase